MKYCLHCGGEVIVTGSGAYSCQKCGAKLYDNPIPGVSSFILTDDEKVVLGVRAKDPQIGMLDGLGGFVDEGETLELALYRELEEEGGIRKKDIAHIEYLTSVCDIYPWRPKAHKVTSAYFIVRLKTGVVLKPADDVSTIETFELADIDPELFAWDGMRQAFNQFQKLFTDF